MNYNHCTYDTSKTSIAETSCVICKAPLCKFCGYRDENEKAYCNECWEKIDAEIKEEEIEQETGICQRCGQQLEPIYENNGFDEFMGTTYYELVGFKPCECRKGNN